MDFKIPVSYIITIILLLTIQSCKKNKDSSISKLCIDGNCNENETISIIADGKSKTLFYFKTNSKSQENNQIIFTVSNGILAQINYTSLSGLSNTLKVSASKGEITGYIISPTNGEETVTLAAKIDNEIYSRQINYMKSMPDSISITTASYLYQKSDPVQVICHLVNLKSGYVSNNIPVFFSAKSINNNNILLQITPSAFSNNNQNEFDAIASLRNLNQDTANIEITGQTTNQYGAKIVAKTYIKFH